MRLFDFSYLLYFIFAAISIIGVAISGLVSAKKTGKERPFRVPEPKILYILGIFILFYLLAFSIEFLGHIFGLWIWLDTDQIFIHAAIWWASILIVALFFLSTLKPYARYGTLLGWVLLFEYLQEALIQWVAHTPIWTPYLTITIVMSVVCVTSLFALDILIKLKLLKVK